MQRIPCPWCGPRAHIEFSYRCDAEAVAPEREDDAATLRRVYARANHIGVHTEIWQHRHGCRGWLRVRRHNLTHEILDTAPAAAEPPP
jgi:methylglutamate dehydrogenase subunit B